MFKKLKKFISKKSYELSLVKTIFSILTNDLKASNDIKSPKVNLGQIQTVLNSQKTFISSINDVEFQVFSQWGDDGIIQYLINSIDIPNKVFIEFGVENYKESNTRFLLINNNWSGLVIDGSKSNIEYIKNDILSWAFDLHAIEAFITKDNINTLIRDFLNKGYNDEIGILSIDIDGNDYWIWKSIHVINPIIIIVEYNAVFGIDNSWTIPYDEKFYRLDYHKSHQYWGASLKAFLKLAETKNYTFVGCNSNGNNAYFIRNDKIGKIKPVSLEEGYRESKFREFTDDNGERIGGKKRLDLIKGMEIFDTEKEQIVLI